MTTSLTFSTKAVLDQAWKILKKHWSFLLGAWLIMGVLTAVTSSIQTSMQQQSEGGLVLVFLALQALGVWLGIGLMRLTLKVVRGEKVDLHELWTGTPYLLQYFVGAMVVGVVSFVGFLLLIVPGIIWSLSYMYTTFILAEEKINFSEAMAQSKAMTAGIKWQIAGFGAVMLGINLLGCLPLFLGLVVTIPLTTLATYVLYVELRKQYLARTGAKLESAPLARMDLLEETK